MPAILKSETNIEAEARLYKTLQKALGLPPRPQIENIQAMPRRTPMKVLCLGMPRTGTFSLFTALGMLGYRPHHMKALIDNAAVEAPCWSEAIEAKFHGKGKPWGREEFDKLLWDNDAVADIPSVLFAEELIKAYPEAKVVLTERPVDGWIKSLAESVGLIWRWNWWPIVWADPVVVGPTLTHADHTFPILPYPSAHDPAYHPQLRKIYAEHYAKIREICPADRLLEFRFGMGFKELCEFLEIPAPRAPGVNGEEGEIIPYPKINDTPMLIGLWSDLYYQVAWLAVQKTVGYGVMLGALGATAAVLSSKLGAGKLLW